MEMKGVAVIGHSFGGITALHAGINNKQVKAVVSLDPWYLPVHKLVESKRYHLSNKSPPTLIINTEDFPNMCEKGIGLHIYDQAKCTETFKEES